MSLPGMAGQEALRDTRVPRVDWLSPIAETAVFKNLSLSDEEWPAGCDEKTKGGLRVTKETD